MQQVTQGDAADVPLEIPSEDASVGQLIKYNYTRIKRDYFDGAQGAVNKKLMLNVSCFVLAVAGMSQYGEKLEWK